MIVTNLDFLRQPCPEFDRKKENLSLLIYQLEEELRLSKVPGVGLAAPQIGVQRQVSIIRMGDLNVDIYNPKILEKKGSVVSTEGCLSIPTKSGEKARQYSVHRYEEVTIENGDGRTLLFTGIEAIVLQHELDHLAGVLVCDKEYRSVKVGRNEKCPCGSGKKYKKCHLGQESALQDKLLSSKKEGVG